MMAIFIFLRFSLRNCYQILAIRENSILRQHQRARQEFPSFSLRVIKIFAAYCKYFFRYLPRWYRTVNAGAFIQQPYINEFCHCEEEALRRRGNLTISIRKLSQCTKHNAGLLRRKASSQ